MVDNHDRERGATQGRPGGAVQAPQRGATRGRGRERGMTLIEILVVLVLIGIVLGIVGGNFIGKGEKAKSDAAKYTAPRLLSVTTRHWAPACIAVAASAMGSGASIRISSSFT